MPVVKRGADAKVVTLGGAKDLGHGRAGQRAWGTGAAQHDGEDVGVEHPLDGDAVGGGFQTRDPAYAFDQGLPVMRAGAAHERAVNVEENQGGGNHS